MTPHAVSYQGGEAAGHGPYDLSSEAISALLKTIEPAGLYADVRGPLEHEQHPADHLAHERRASPARSSAMSHETRGPIPNTPAPTKSWLAAFSGKAGFPADAQIAVSSSTVIVSNRQQLRYYSKNGVALGSAIGSKSFFSGLNLKDAAGNTIDRFNDVRLIFDSYRKRFWVTAYAFYSGNATVPAAKQRFYIPLAVSKTENPNDGWYLYYTEGASQQGNANSQIWKAGDAPDYPIMGIDKQAITITHAVNHTAGGGYWRVVLFPADSLSNGQWQNGWQFWDLKNPDGSQPGRIAPVVHHGTSGGSRAYWLGRQGSDSIVVWAITHPFDAARHVQAVAVLLQGFSSPVNGQQKGSTQLIKFTNLGNDVLKGVFRNEFLHMVTNDAHDWGSIGKVRTSIHYVRVPVSQFPSIPLSPNSNAVDRIFGGGNPNEEIGGLKHYGWASVEVNKNGDAIMGYVRTGEQVYPEVRGSAYMHNESDIRPSVQVKAGEKPEAISYYPAPNAVLAWADTSGASVDPSDDTSVWIAQEYASSTSDPNGNYDIWVARFFGS